MIRKCDVTKKVDALRELVNRSFVWMDRETSFAPEPLFNKRKKPSKLGWGVGKDDRVVGVTNVMLHS